MVEVMYNIEKDNKNLLLEYIMGVENYCLIHDGMDNCFQMDF